MVKIFSKRPLFATITLLILIILGGCRNTITPPPPAECPGPRCPVPGAIFLLDTPRNTQNISGLLGQCVRNGEFTGYPFINFLGVEGVLTQASYTEFNYRSEGGDEVSFDASIDEIASGAFESEVRDSLEYSLTDVSLVQPTQGIYALPFAVNCKVVSGVLVAGGFEITSSVDFSQEASVKLDEALKKTLGISVDVEYKADENKIVTAFGTDLVVGIQALRIEPAGGTQLRTESYSAQPELGNIVNFTGTGPTSDRFAIGLEQVSASPSLPTELALPRDAYCLSLQVIDNVVIGNSDVDYYCPRRDEMVGDIIPEYVQNFNFRSKQPIKSLTYQRNEGAGVATVAQAVLVIVDDPSMENDLSFEVDPSNNQVISEANINVNLRLQAFRYRSPVTLD